MSDFQLPDAKANKEVSLFDARPFFEKTLVYGLQHGIINQAKLDAIQSEAPKGMVQIARYFGSEFLRPELEKARERIVNLVSMNLEYHSAGDLQKAAERIMAGEMDYRIELWTGDEIQEFAESFNALIQQLQDKQKITLQDLSGL